jgi:hypothetical protein
MTIYVVVFGFAALVALVVVVLALGRPGLRRGADVKVRFEFFKRTRLIVEIKAPCPRPLRGS